MAVNNRKFAALHADMGRGRPRTTGKSHNTKSSSYIHGVKKNAQLLRDTGGGITRFLNKRQKRQEECLALGRTDCQVFPGIITNLLIYSTRIILGQYQSLVLPRSGL